MSVLPTILHDEAWHRAKFVRSLKNDPRIAVQRFEDGYALGVSDLFVGSSNQGMWVETKCHQPAPSGVLLPRSKVPGTQIDFLQSMNGRPNRASILLFTETSWICCPITHVEAVLFDNKDQAILRTGCPRTFADLLLSMSEVDRWMATRTAPLRAIS